MILSFDTIKDTIINLSYIMKLNFLIEHNIKYINKFLSKLKTALGIVVKIPQEHA